MLTFEHTIRIHRPIAEVFAFLADFENLPKWNYYVLDIRKRSDGPIGIGTTYHQVRKTDEQDFRTVTPPSNPVLTCRVCLSLELLIVPPRQGRQCGGCDPRCALAFLHPAGAL